MRVVSNTFFDFEITYTQSRILMDSIYEMLFMKDYFSQLKGLTENQPYKMICIDVLSGT
jgi:hypothetical protein